MLLGSWIHRKFNVENDIERQLDQLLTVVGETVSVSIQNGIYAQYVSAQFPYNPARMEVQSGLQRPITMTAGGRVLLSLKNDKEIVALVRRCNSEVDEPRLRVQPSRFIEIIGDVRARGYASTEGEMTPGYGAYAVVVPGPVGKIPLAIIVGGPIKRLKAKEGLILDALFDLKAKLESSG